MSLAAYRVHDGVDVALHDPFGGRLEQLLDRFAGRVLILSGRRSYAEQTVLWLRYLSGAPEVAARPGTSLHERGQAADLRIVDPAVAWPDVHAAAAEYGLRFPIVSEDWHVELDPAWTPATVPPDDPTEAPMTPRAPTLRPGTHDVWDYLFLPADGPVTLPDGRARWSSSTLVLGMAAEDANRTVVVYWPLMPGVTYQLDWAAPLLLTVPASGRVSVVGANVVVEHHGAVL